MVSGCRCPATAVYAVVVKRLGVQYLKEAAADQERAVEEYGAVLAGAIDRVIDRIRVLPRSGPVHDGVESEYVLRRVLVRKFRFVVYYYIFSEVVTVVAVAPPRIQPGYWHKRVEH